MEMNTLKALVEARPELTAEDLELASLYVTCMKYAHSHPEDTEADSILATIKDIVAEKTEGTRQDVVALTLQLAAIVKERIQSNGSQERF